MATKRQMEKESRINSELERLYEIFKDVPEDDLNLVSSLIKNAAFMAVTLEDLQDIINRKGTTEKYKNGANQFGLKKRPEVELYNVMIKNHAAIIKQLGELQPKNPFGISETEIDASEDDDGVEAVVRTRDD